ncbi:General transcription factor IIH subunit 2 [Cymbomonas tetramitiformis]|uniref:General transcription factor IIH subunit 2 n=1 Tax=Cymbomonas tetramitiformis TaxID=36881 RepID=A0AAE0C3J1_9CHLO|nr:General transcription factor IIH subunit 2 [Cymbomonas tetramitiformis]
MIGTRALRTSGTGALRGFPSRTTAKAPAYCTCHRDLRPGPHFICPRCQSRVCDLPMECPTCGITLVSSPHLARSYHHLFPVPPFAEVCEEEVSGGHLSCFGCGVDIPSQGGVRLRCEQCREVFCFDCDTYVHDSLHNCPGCEMKPDRAAPNSAALESIPS